MQATTTEETGVKSIVEAYLVQELMREREARLRSRAGKVEAEPVLIRAASRRDQRRLRRLAQLDSAPQPSGAMLIAERSGCLVAAVPLDGGRAIADPFEPTAEVVSLLELRRTQLAA